MYFFCSNRKQKIMQINLNLMNVTINLSSNSSSTRGSWVLLGLMILLLFKKHSSQPIGEIREPGEFQQSFNFSPNLMTAHESCIIAIHFSALSQCPHCPLVRACEDHSVPQVTQLLLLEDLHIKKNENQIKQDCYLWLMSYTISQDRTQNFGASSMGRWRLKQCCQLQFFFFFFGRSRWGWGYLCFGIRVRPSLTMSDLD